MNKSIQTYFKLIQETINNAREGRTVILVAHRLSTVSKYLFRILYQK